MSNEAKEAAVQDAVRQVLAGDSNGFSLITDAYIDMLYQLAFSLCHAAGMQLFLELYAMADWQRRRNTETA